GILGVGSTDAGDLAVQVALVLAPRRPPLVGDERARLPGVVPGLLVVGRAGLRVIRGLQAAVVLRLVRRAVRGRVIVVGGLVAAVAAVAAVAVAAARAAVRHRVE